MPGFSQASSLFRPLRGNGWTFNPQTIRRCSFLKNPNQSIMLKVIIADRIAPVGIEYLENNGNIEVVKAFGKSESELLELVPDADAIIVRSETRITRKVLEAASDLKAVGRAGVGVDNIDVEAATELGVIVMNAPEGNTIATAELTMTHLLCGVRPVPQANASMQAGKWNRKQFAGSELSGKSLAIIGMGRIGAEVARRARAFEMKILGVDPYLTETRARSLDVEVVEFDEAMVRADFITVHMPLTEKTRHMIDESAFAKMKDGVRIFNVARGGIIKESALAEALQSGKVAAAGLDVYEEEPLPDESPLRGLPNLVLTPHLGASTAEAQEGVGIQIAEAISEAIMGGVIHNAINAPTVDAKTLQILRPYLNLGTRLGTFIQQITPDQIDELKITYWGKIVDLDALPLTRAIQRGYLLTIKGNEVNDVNAPLEMKRLGIAVNTTKSNTEMDYNELIEVRAIGPDGSEYSVQGTLLGNAQLPRIHQVNGREIEVTPEGALLLVENRDTPGIVGTIGTLLGRAEVNIANLSLHRSQVAQTALAIFELDSDPGPETIEHISGVEGVIRTRLIHC